MAELENNNANSLLLSDGRFEVDEPKVAELSGFRELKTFFESMPASFKRARAEHNHHPASSIPPSLNIVIQIVGSRGDVQPFIPIAQALSSAPYNHRVRIATHGRFKSFVEGHGLELFDIGGDPEALMAYMVKNPGLVPGRESMGNGDIRRRRQDIADILDGIWRSCIEPSSGTATTPAKPFVADAIIANPVSYGHIHCAERLGIPLHIMFTMPWSPTRAFPHPLANVKNTGQDPKFLNLASFQIAEMVVWAGLGDVINSFRERTLGLAPIHTMTAATILHQVPHTYLWSEGLIPKPIDWNSGISIAGFCFPLPDLNYVPPPRLEEFLAQGPAPIYIGFGSIPLENPHETMNMILEAVDILQIRAVISRGWAKLDSPNPPENILLIDDVPHDWLFPRVSCVVHHGGAGTTSIGLKLGRPTVVIPFFGDQPFWGAMVHRAGAGPSPIPFRQLTVEALVGALRKALSLDSIRGAQNLQSVIASEQGAKQAVAHFHNSLYVAKMRCCIDPTRTAVWRVGTNGHRLSAAAAVVLHDAGLVDLNKLNLIKHREWIVDRGPSNPVDGALAPLILKTQGGLSWPGTPKVKAKVAEPETKTACTYAQDTFEISATPNDETSSNVINIQENSLQAPGSNLTTIIPGICEESPASYDNPALISDYFHAERGSSSESTTSTHTEYTPTSEPGSSRSSTFPARKALPSSFTPSPQPSPILGAPAREPHASKPLRPRSSTEPSLSALPRFPTHHSQSAWKISLKALHTTIFDIPISIAHGAVEGLHNTNTLLFSNSNSTSTSTNHNTNHNDNAKNGNDNHQTRPTKDLSTRPFPHITSLSTGLREAALSPALNLYSGLKGLYSYPVDGFDRNGVLGAAVGFGKAIGNLYFRIPSACVEAPAFLLMGFSVELGKLGQRAGERERVAYLIGMRRVMGVLEVQGMGVVEREGMVGEWERLAKLRSVD